jgi:hypothetical protein
MMESVITDQQDHRPTSAEVREYMRKEVPPCAEVVQVVELGGVMKLMASFKCSVPVHQTVLEYVAACQRAYELRSIPYAERPLA